MSDPKSGVPPTAIPAAQPPSPQGRDEMADRAAGIARFQAGEDDAVIITRAGSIGVSLQAASQESYTLSKHVRTWRATAADNHHFASGERMLVVDKYRRVLTTHLNDDGRSRVTLEPPKPTLVGVPPLARKNAETVKAWLETARPEYAPYRMCDFEEFARMQANLIERIANVSPRLKTDLPIESVEPHSSIVSLDTIPPSLVEPNGECDPEPYDCGPEP
jgi:hypothetical protein